MAKAKKQDDSFNSKKEKAKMILPFSTQISGKPTYFVEKIWSGLLKIDDELYSDYLHPDGLPPQMKWPSYYNEFKPKIHTIREDKTDRWKAGNKIDFFINCRQPNMFRFAPVLPVASVQKVQILYKGLFVAVAIDGVLFYSSSDNSLGSGKSAMLQLAQNDGFDTMEDFFAYFNEDFTGKIIHWTDLKY